MLSPRGRLVSILIALLIALSAAMPAIAQQASPVASPVAESQHGIRISDMDLSADPAEDFYRFANGNWLDRTEIPADKPRYGVFEELGDLTESQLLDLLGDLSSSDTLVQGSDEWKAVQLYKQGNDLETRNAQGVEPIRPILDHIDAITDLDSFHTYLETASFEYISSLISIFSYADLVDSSVTSAYLSGPYYGLPTRDYYLEDTPDNEAARASYIDASAKLLVETGMTPAAAAEAAQANYDFEKELVTVTYTREEQQDYSLIYNPTSIADLKTTYPLMDWDAYLTALGIPDVTQLIVTEPRYLAALAGIVEKTPIETLKSYLTLEAIWSFSSNLSEKIEEIAFDYQGTTLYGLTEQEPIEKRTLGQVNALLGDAIGKLYVAEYFPPEAKATIETLVSDLIAAYRERLETNAWLSPETKEIALAKLDAMRVKVGYPDADDWLDYQDVDVADSYAITLLNASNAFYRRGLAEVGKPVDRDRWNMNVQTVNAGYDTLNNDITFPAAILQPPFFDYQADPASNFGAIGFVIGHEITHGFDQQGSQFDKDGNFANWWTDADAAAFQELNDRVVAQYDAIEVLPDLFVNGQITIGENVADMGGLQVAYQALHTALAASGDPGEIDGFTQDQRFFIAAAQVWHEKSRNDYLETLIATDEHSPATVRGTQPLRNMDTFYDAFEIFPGDAMYLAPEERVVIW
jgi:predicted metalloendopeptidase